MSDDRNADGVKPGTFKVEDGKIYVANVVPVRIGPDEYETRVRWHVASYKDTKRYRLTEQNRVGILLTVLEQTEKPSEGKAE